MSFLPREKVLSPMKINIIPRFEKSAWLLLYPLPPLHSPNESRKIINGLKTNFVLLNVA